MRLAFSADTCGQGWGIDEARGGMRLFESVRQAAPDLFVHCGDTIYADQPLAAERTLDDGSVWRNLVTPAKSKVAETLDEFRGNRYSPERTRFRDFRPFYEIVAGPAHAGTFGPGTLDLTFGPEVRFLGIPPGMRQNRPPSDGLQFFGLLDVEGKSGVLRVEIRNRDGATLHRLELEPERAGGPGAV